MKLGLMLASPPDRPELAEASRLANEAMDRADTVFLYLIDDGVRSLDASEIEGLRRRGVRLFACAYGAKKRGIAWDPAKAVFSGLTVLVDVITGCDRFFALTPLGRSPASPPPAPTPGRLPRTLVTVTEDPAVSHRPAEAVRIAAGIGGWKKTEVDLLLEGPASRLLSPWAEEFVDGENYGHYLPLLREGKRPVFFAPGAERFEEIEEATLPIEWLDAAGVAALRAQAAFQIPF
ncbi:MAG: DsrE family protein [Verrucomicrobiae bacterium]|nr:DsrE family protein [Verrucomicrobiae bacterium]